jgi:hypothetical protein
MTASLDILIEQMSETQKHQFRRALVEQCVHFLTPAMPPEDQDTGERTGIRFAQQWLADPASVEISTWVVRAEADIWDGGVRSHDYGEEVFAPIFIVAANSLSHAANYAVRAARFMIGSGPAEDHPITERDAQEAAKRWQIEAARAILHDQELPLLNAI